MQRYTGIHFKTRALLLIAENPLRADLLDCLTIDRDLHRIHWSYALANLSYVDRGSLSLDDLPDIEAAIAENARLRQAYAHYEQYQRDIYYPAEKALLNARSAAEQEALIAAGVVHPCHAKDVSGKRRAENTARYNAIVAEVHQQFAPNLASLHDLAAQAAILSTPWRARHATTDTYFAEVDARVRQVTRLTRAEECALELPSPAWRQDWDAFMAKFHDARQQRFLRAARAQSRVGSRVTESGLGDNYLFSEFFGRDNCRATAEALFPDGQLTDVVAFYDHMVCRHAADHFYGGPVPPYDLVNCTALACGIP